jgi:hypothetical protein
MGSTENIGDKIYTVGIYEEEYLDEAALEKQNKIIEGFNSL